MAKKRDFMGKVYADGENQKALGYVLELARLPQVDMTDANEVKERIEQFFDICVKNDSRPTVANLAVALGISRKTLFNYRQGTVKRIPLEVMGVLDRACAILNADLENLVISGKGNVVGEIFLMKNSFEDYTDSREIVHTNRNEITAEELLQKASLLPGFEQMKIEDKEESTQ